LTAGLRALAFSEIRMRGVVARRRTAHFGWTYGYETWRIEPGPPIPDVLLPLRARAATLVAVDASALAEALVTEYTPGAGIGWHRDAPMFGVVIGVSLLGACRFRFRRDGRDAAVAPEARLEPRSVYVLDGEARSAWQHSIPPTRSVRYSVTFRTLREQAPRHRQRI
jgi:DNA oxidative demethylase